MKKNNKTALGMTQKENLKDIIFFTLSFLVPLIIMTLIWNGIGISYGGQVTPLIYDMEVQVMPFLASLRYLADGTNSLFFTWGNALGGNFFGTWAYYMASPLNWLTVFYDLKDMPDAIYLLTIIRVGLCGLTFAFFVRYGLAGERCGISNVIFPCCYALMSYNIMYSSSPMWIDGVVMLPLVLLGVERLIKGKKGILYFLSILITFICSYYISYIIGIFSAVYMLCRVFMTKTKMEIRSSVGVICRFGVLSLLALGAAMPIFLPAMESISLGKDVFYEGGVENLMPGAYEATLLDKVQKLLPGQYDTIENQGAPSVYCGTLMLVLALVFLFQKKHGIKSKVCYVTLLLFPVAGFLNHYVDYAYHVFKYPNSYPYRYAFLFSAVILMMAWHAFQNIPRKAEFSKLLTGIGIFYLCLELFFNGSAIVMGLHKETAYSVRNAWDLIVDYCQPLAEEIREDDEFARTEMAYNYLQYNSAQLYGLNGATSFVSTFNNNVNRFYNVMGARKYSIISNAQELTPLGDSLLGIKYRIDPADKLNGYEVKKVSEVQTDAGVGKMYLHENKNALSLGYMVPAESGDFAFTEDSYANQNLFVSAMLGEDTEVFKPIPVSEKQEEEGTQLEFEALSDNPIYIYVVGERVVQTPAAMEEGLPLEIKTETEDLVCYVHNSSNFCIGNYGQGERITITINDDDLVYKSAYIYEMDMEEYERVLDKLREAELQVQSYHGGKIKGTVSAKENGVLLLTLPVDGGYKVILDGEQVEYGSAMGTFLSVLVEQGEHEIEITYVSPGFETGLRISLISMVVFALWFIVEKCKDRKATSKLLGKM